MVSDIQDTIVALSSAPGPGGRAIVRLSGGKAFPIAFAFFKPFDHPATNLGASLTNVNAGGSTQVSAPSTSSSADVRRRYEGALRLPELSSPLPASLLAWPEPRTYTGQNLAELHLLSTLPLVELLITSLLNAGARAAQPGEFTQRAFLAGKLDLPRAEAVLAVIEAGGRDDLKQALTQLAGGVSRPLQGLRDDLLDLLAEVEAGLDFAEEDIRFVQPEELLKRLAKGMAQVTLLSKQLEKRALTGSAFRVALAGQPNAGKSSLFNALTGAAALVSPEPGTTRDYLMRRMLVDGIPIDLIDTAGWKAERTLIDSQTQLLGKQQTEEADLILLCLESGIEFRDDEFEWTTRPGSRPVLRVATKCDLAKPPDENLATSAKTRAGLDDLRRALADRARSCQRESALASSLSRCKHHVAATLELLRRAHSVVLFSEPSEVLALELRGALDELGSLVGAVYTDDLLDRIFSRFCIGK
jgi:tRNA modification GTPase